MTLFCESSGFFEIDNVEPKARRTNQNPKGGIVEAHFEKILSNLYERLESKMVEDPVTGCWNWTGTKDSSGYGRVSFFKRPRAAYRVVYELYCDRIPDGLHLDHLCRNPSCCNPMHLEPVTHAENMRRSSAGEISRARNLAKTHCKKGHELVQGTRQRHCPICKNERRRRLRAISGPGQNLDGLRLGAKISAAKRTAATHCKRGYEFTPENTGKQVGGRYCKKCDSLRGQKTYKDQ